MSTVSPSLGPLRFGHHTHQGPRDTNQDTVLSIHLPDGRWLLAVADGMGGLEEGELASKTALGTLYKSLSEGAGLVEAVKAANTAVDREAQGRAMGTTLVAAVVSETRAEVVNVGDSRAYHSDLLGLIQVTEDHTMAYEALRDGSTPIDEIEDESGRWANALGRYLGAGPQIDVDRFGPLDLLEGGWLLLCSDGLHGVMSLDEIDAFLVGKSDVDAAATGLVEEALKRNTGDNVSVVLAHWPETSATVAPSAQPRTQRRGERKEAILFRSDKKRGPKKRVGLALKIFFVVIPLIIVFLLVRYWILSP